MTALHSAANPVSQPPAGQEPLDLEAAPAVGPDSGAWEIARATARTITRTATAVRAGSMFQEPADAAPVRAFSSLLGAADALTVSVEQATRLYETRSRPDEPHPGVNYPLWAVSTVAVAGAVTSAAFAAAAGPTAPAGEAVGLLVYGVAAAAMVGAERYRPKPYIPAPTSGQRAGSAYELPPWQGRTQRPASRGSTPSTNHSEPSPQAQRGPAR
ncbi:hypothetical protein OG946_15070 [Streptomyces sp. NBC_01808]|uniref:hypothetical protein n=1 Tax=Streptomyces sp. NBC_01808 TaxID=2975947 RepID=UPI002DD807CA|nr:hypothetical protein [Streptomyces sp. NBC_01808]WSA38581.1 hypothetical protein OG946_15070 [Streptomyces sp. NBC_01808]